MELKRLFIAIDISEEVRTAIDVYVRSLREVRTEGVRWEKIEKIHLTLRFLGDTAVEKIPDIETVLTQITSRNPAFELTIEGSGVFPNEWKARVMWIGIKPCEPLNRLYQEIETSLENVGLPKEGRRFNPHLTIARIKDPKNAARVIQTHLMEVFGPFTVPVDEVVLYESKLLKSGSEYSPINTFPLKTN